jgi:hypothetical protein
MEKECTVSINENEIAKIAVLNSIRVEDVDSNDISWTLKLLLSQKVISYK